MRGYSAGSILDSRSFILLDRLYEILNHKIKIWIKDLEEVRPFQKAMLKKLFVRESPATKMNRKEAENDILLQQMIAAYDLAAAFNYMHQNR